MPPAARQSLNTMNCLLLPAPTWLQDAWEKPFSPHPSCITRSMQTILTRHTTAGLPSARLQTSAWL